jgi:hypothetical protein
VHGAGALGAPAALSAAAPSKLLGAGLAADDGAAAHQPRAALGPVRV